MENNNNNNNFLTLEEYQKLAYITIKKYANNSKRLKRDVDVIGEIIRWAARSDETYRIIPGKYDGSKGSIEGRRCVWAKYGLLKALKKIRNRQARETVTIDEIALQVEDKRSIRNKDVEDILEILDNKEIISEQEKGIFISYVYENMTYKEVGKKYNLSYETIRLKIDKISNKIRENLK